MPSGAAFIISGTLSSFPKPTLSARKVKTMKHPIDRQKEREAHKAHREAVANENRKHQEAHAHPQEQKNSRVQDNVEDGTTQMSPMSLIRGTGQVYDESKDASDHSGAAPSSPAFAGAAGAGASSDYGY